MNKSIRSLVCICSSFSIMLMAMNGQKAVSSSPFLLENKIAGMLIRGIQNYSKIATELTQGKKTLYQEEVHPIAKAYNFMINIMDTPDTDNNSCLFTIDEESDSERTFKIANNPNILPHLKVIHTYYYNNTIHERKKAYKTGNWNEVTPAIYHHIAEKVEKMSSFVCLSERASTTEAQIQNLITLNQNASIDDIPVYIAGVYALFVQKQEIENAKKSAKKRLVNTKDKSSKYLRH